MELSARYISPVSCISTSLLIILQQYCWHLILIRTVEYLPRKYSIITSSYFYIFTYHFSKYPQLTTDSEWHLPFLSLWKCASRLWSPQKSNLGPRRRTISLGNSTLFIASSTFHFSSALLATNRKIYVEACDIFCGENSLRLSVQIYAGTTYNFGQGRPLPLPKGALGKLRSMSEVRNWVFVFMAIFPL